MTTASIRRTGGGTFDPADRLAYFLAVDPSVGQHIAHLHRHLLVPLNVLRGPKAGERLAELDRWIAQGGRLLLDSGIYALATEHAAAHGVTMDEALRLPPEGIDGFAELWDTYVTVVPRLEARLWGYIELDQGGRLNKARTRDQLEQLDLRPIPVYHPLLDGWEYFDTLAQGYDRLCVGNVVQAPRPVRLRILATIAERARAYPHLWVHYLGVTPSPWLLAYPQASCDSSAWLHGVRWTGQQDKAALANAGRLPVGFSYQIGSPVDGPAGNRKGWQFGAYLAHMHERNWQRMLADRDRGTTAA